MPAPYENLTAHEIWRKVALGLSQSVRLPLSNVWGFSGTLLSPAGSKVKRTAEAEGALWRYSVTASPATVVALSGSTGVVTPSRPASSRL